MTMVEETTRGQRFDGRRGERFERNQELALSFDGAHVPPHDLDAEGVVLSAILLDKEAFDLVQGTVKPEHFYSEANRRIYEGILELSIASKPVDAVSVAGWLRDRGRLDSVGGVPYIAQLTDFTPAVANVEEHAKSVREKWRARQLITVCQRFAAEGFGDYGEIQDYVDRAEQAIFDIARVSQGSAVVPLSEAVKSAFFLLGEAQKRGGGISGTPTGYTELDRLTSGLHKGDLYIVAARPGMGKTAFVLNMALNIATAALNTPEQEADATRGRPGVVFFSLEMPKEQLAARLLALDARVSVSLIRSGNLHDPRDWARLTDSASRLSRTPVWLDDTPALSLLELRARVRRLQASIERGDPNIAADRLGLVAIDYLQLMQGSKTAGSREQEISELSRGLKQLAKEMGVPVLALSQLNRSVETRNTKDKRPQLSDLRESGAIEQDADAIMFIYRDDYYFRDSEEPGVADIIIAKQRNGPTDTVKLKYTKEFTRFDNLARDEYLNGEGDNFGDFDAPGP